MPWNREDARGKIRHRIQQIAGELRRDARGLHDDDVIARSGLLDSAGILSLIVWCEEEFGVELRLDEITVDNFGTVNRMLDYLSQAV
jgi:acyl carrier protein